MDRGRARLGGRLTLVLLAAAACIATALPAPAARAAADSIGRTVFVRGAATAEPKAGGARILGKGAPLFQGDVLRTAPRSFAVLEFKDGTRTTLRPGTVFRVDEFVPPAEEAPEAGGGIASRARAALRLFKGGLRVITGLIGKRNRRGFSLSTPVATIGIRGTDFEARLCGDDCKEEHRRVKARVDGRSRVVARVAFTNGKLTARDRAGKVREVSLGGSLLEGDLLETGDGSLAVVVFRDESRVTLQANSRFQIERMRYDPEKPEEASALVRFLQGGVRIASGLIAKIRGEAFQVETPVATISVRGTRFDLRCLGSCKEDAAAAPGAPASPVARLVDGLVRPAHAQTGLPGGSGLATYVLNGSIQFQTPGGTFTFGAGKAVFSNGVQTIELPTVPVFFQTQTIPGTDPSINEGELFSAVQQAEPETGLYVRVIEGDVDVGGTLLGRGETGYTGAPQAPAVRLVVSPRLLLTPDPKVDYDALGFPSGGERTTNFECVVQ